MQVYQLIALLSKAPDLYADVVIHDHGTDWALTHLEVRKPKIPGPIILAADPEDQAHFNGLRGTSYEVIK